MLTFAVNNNSCCVRVTVLFSLVLFSFRCLYCNLGTDEGFLLLYWDKLEHICAHVLLIDLVNMVKNSLTLKKKMEFSKRPRLQTSTADVGLLRLKTIQPLWMELLTSKHWRLAHPCTGGLMAACLQRWLNHTETGRDELFENVGSLSCSFKASTFSSYVSQIFLGNYFEFREHLDPALLLVIVQPTTFSFLCFQ